MIIDSLKDFFDQCPLMAGEAVDVDYLGKNSDCYSLDPLPAEPIVKKYAGGGCMKQYAFIIAGRERYGLGKNRDNAAFYERLEAWIEEKNRKGELPDLGKGRTAQMLEVTASGYMFEEDIQSAGYHLQCRLIYTQM